MLHMIQVLLVVLWLLVVPFGCGLAVSKYLPAEKQTIGMICINGYLLMIALFHCFYLVFLLCGNRSFGLLSIIFGIFIGLFSLFSMWIGRSAFKVCLQHLKKKEAIAAKTIFVMVVLIQIVMRLVQQVSDGDDAFYIATATATWGSDVMNYIQPYTGFKTTNLDMRHAFSSAPVWLAFLSEVTMIHPAAMGHSVLAPILILLHYGVVLNMGDVFFKEKKTEKYLFAGLMGLFNMYGYVSIYTAQTFFLTRTWQGKSIFANLFLPFVFLLLLCLAEYKKGEREKNIYFIVTGIAMFAAASMTTMATIMLPTLFMFGIVFLAVTLRNYRLLWKGLLACVPAGVVGVAYFLAQ